jgi:ribosomal protein L37AE/L43A
MTVAGRDSQMPRRVVCESCQYYLEIKDDLNEYWVCLGCGIVGEGDYVPMLVHIKPWSIECPRLLEHVVAGEPEK